MLLSCIQTLHLPVIVVSCMLWHLASAGASWSGGVGICLTCSVFHRRGYGATTHKEGEAEDEFGFVTMVSGIVASLPCDVIELLVVVALQNPEASDWHTQLLLSAGEAAHAAILCGVRRLGEGDALLRPGAQGVATVLGFDGSYSKLCNLQPLPQRLAPAGRPLRSRQRFTVWANLQTC